MLLFLSLIVAAYTNASIVFMGDRDDNEDEDAVHCCCCLLFLLQSVFDDFDYGIPSPSVAFILKQRTVVDRIMLLNVVCCYSKRRRQLEI